jgi:hypothetical protein
MRLRAAIVSICLVAGAAAEETAPEAQYYWRMTVHAPVVAKDGLIAVRLYPEVCSGVRYFRVRAAGEDLPWRIETAAGEVLGTSYAAFSRGLSVEKDIYLVFRAPSSDETFAITAYRGELPSDMTMPRGAGGETAGKGGGGVEARFYRFVPEGDVERRRRWRPTEEMFQTLIGATQPFETRSLLHAWLTAAPAQQPDFFVARLTATLILPFDGRYIFGLDADDCGLLTITQDGTTVRTLKGGDGMFEGRPAQLEGADLRAGAARFEAWFRDDTGAQGIIPYWQPPGYTKPVIIPSWAFASCPEARAVKYEAAEDAPYPFIHAVEAGAFKAEVQGWGPPAGAVAVFEVRAVGRDGPADPQHWFLEADGRRLQGAASACEVVGTRQDAPVRASGIQRPSAKRRLFSRRELNPDAASDSVPDLLDPLIIREKTVLSAPAAFTGEEVTAGFYREIVSTPPLCDALLPIAITTRFEELAAGNRSIRNEETPLRSKMSETLALRAANGSATVAQEMWLAGSRIGARMLRLLPAEEASALNLAADGNRLIASDGTIVIPVLRHITPAEQRKWYPVRAAVKAVRPVSRVDIASATGQALNVASALLAALKATGAAAETFGPPSAGAGLLEIAAALWKKSAEDATLAVLLGRADETTGMSPFAYERAFALVLYAARRCGYVRVAVCGNGRYMDKVKAAADEYQIAVIEQTGKDDKDAAAVMNALGPF